MNNLVDVKKMSNEDIMKAIGQDDGSTTPTLPRLMINRNPEDDEGNRKQPDCIVYLPDEKNIVIDSKVSMVAYENYINSNNDNYTSLNNIKNKALTFRTLH